MLLCLGLEESWAHLSVSLPGIRGFCSTALKVVDCNFLNSNQPLMRANTGTQRMMTEHKMKISNKCNSVFFTQGKWALMSGMVDMIMKASDEGRTELKLVGPDIRY